MNLCLLIPKHEALSMTFVLLANSTGCVEHCRIKEEGRSQPGDPPEGLEWGLSRGGWEEAYRGPFIHPGLVSVSGEELSEGWAVSGGRTETVTLEHHF